MSNPTDTNQASEDELDNTLRAVYGAGYLANQIDLELEDGEPMLEAAIGVACKSVESIIRTEKLKLLAEVRERVVGSRDDEERYRDLSKYKQRKVIIEYEQRVKQLAEINKLEAEL